MRHHCKTTRILRNTKTSFQQMIFDQIWIARKLKDTFSVQTSQKNKYIIITRLHDFGET